MCILSVFSSETNFYYIMNIIDQSLTAIFTLHNPNTITQFEKHIKYVISYRKQGHEASLAQTDNQSGLYTLYPKLIHHG